MIIIHCPNPECTKLIVLPFDSKDDLENVASHIECVHCHRLWSVNDLLRSMNEILSEPSVLDNLSEDINSFNSADEICDNLKEIGHRYCIDELVVKEFANIEIAKRKKNNPKQDLLHFVEMKKDHVSLSDLKNLVDKAIKQYKVFNINQHSVIVSRSNLEKQLDFLQKENHSLKKELEALTTENDTLKKQLKRFL